MIQAFVFKYKSLIASRDKDSNLHHDCHATWVKVTFEKQIEDQTSAFKN